MGAPYAKGADVGFSAAPTYMWRFAPLGATFKKIFGGCGLKMAAFHL